MFLKVNNKITLSVFILILVGSLLWSITMVKSGLLYNYGMGFWGPNGHDGIWHIAVSESLARGSWVMPVFAGENLKNYHIGFDLLLAFLHKLTLIPIHTLYFQILPPIYSLVIGLLVYWFIFNWRKSNSAAFWSLIFVYFSGSFGWIITLLRSNEISGESLFWSQQALSTLVNPPFAFSLIIILIGLILLQRGVKTKKNRYFVYATFLFGLLIQVKVYAGLLVLAGLLSAGIFRLSQRKGFTLLKIFSGALIISLIFLLPILDLSQSGIVFKPFWFLETMMSDQSRLHWPKFAEAMVNYRLAGFGIKGILAYLAALIIFIIGNLGLRIISFPYIYRKMMNLNKLNYLHIFVFTIIVFGILIPTFFVQANLPWNTIQFFYYSLFFLAILSGIGFSEFIETKSVLIKISLIGLVIVFSISTSIATLRHYVPSRPPAMISNEELEALNFLKAQPGGIILTIPFDKLKAEKAVDNPPRPLYLYESTAYVSAFTGMQTYLEDEVNLEIMGYEWKGRRSEIENENENENEFKNLIKKNNIKYIYVTKEDFERFNFGEFVTIFDTSEVKIYATMSI